MRFSFGNESLLHLLWVIPGLVVVYWYGFARRRRALARFAAPALVGQLTPQVSVARQKFKAVLFLAALACLVLAVSRPRWGEREVEVIHRDLDVMVLLDVSRSMLADDCRPNRLEKAKQYIKDMLEIVPGDRVGLVVFGGKAKMACPLTTNYGWFRMALDEVDPMAAPQGGSNLAEAIRLAASKLRERPGDDKAILLLTDGEDQDSDPRYAAAYAFEDHGVRTFAIGLGDAGTGSRIPIETEDGGTEYVTDDQGREHYSKMNAVVLEEIAESGGNGFAVPAGTAEVDMADYYRRMTAIMNPQDFRAQQQRRYKDRYQWFAVAALALLMIETLVTGSRNGRQLEVRSKNSEVRR